jgi:hypothetical protein
MTDWEYVKDFYKEHFGIEGWVVELYANLDILTLCASGASNKTITEVCDIELDDLVEILMHTFKFPGWYADLPINPYKLYSDLDGDYDKFFAEAKISNVFELRIIPDVYSICKTLKELEERIADEWI